METFSTDHQFMTNKKDERIWRKIKEDKEQYLSPLACKNTETKGRMVHEEKCPIRTDFERDSDRILYSMDFRRLRHKTQVFFNARNDHICTRMEHVLYVASISTTIARTLDLNDKLAYAIGLGHDLGHAPFGHSGERVLSRCLQKVSSDQIKFKHELHSLRVVDRIARRISKEGSDKYKGLNLTFEVRDGIVSHCGEKRNEYKIVPDRNKDMKDLEGITSLPENPYSLEACVVKIVDKIAYVGRDIEDAMRVKLINIDDISKDVKDELGVTNGEIINTLVLDLVNNSYEKDYIALSEEKGKALSELISENYDHIYSAENIIRYEKGVQNIIEGLFEYLYDSAGDFEKMEKSEIKVLRNFCNFIKEGGFEEEPAWRKTVDFIAGMTDNYANVCYIEIFNV